jgi:hypothetical protein
MKLPREMRRRIKVWCNVIGKRAKRAIIVSQRTRHFARLAQIPSAGSGQALRETKSLSLRMTAFN